MKKSYMRQIATMVVRLETLIESMEQEQEFIEEKIQAINDKADEAERDLTEKEENRIAALEEEMEDYSNCANELQNAIDYLSRYAEE